MVKSVKITEDMKIQAKIEANKRDNFIKHHFEVAHLSYNQRDILGFLGEFACCEYLGIDWRDNIRDNYYTIDDCDLIIGNKKIDIKTETIPEIYAKKIRNLDIKDNELYGCRLINQGQFNLLHKYDLIIFGFFVRNNLNHWYPIGWIDSEYIVNNITPSKLRPDGGEYPFPAAAVPTSLLKDLSELI